MKYYHCSLILLELGSIIRPGNYGRLVNLHRKEEAINHHLYREIIFELIRSYEFPDKPSRYGSTFVCENLKSINNFKNNNCKTGVIYEVELLNNDAKSHMTNFGYIDLVYNNPTDICEIARDYWQFTNPSKWKLNSENIEIITNSSLRIIQEIQL